MKRIIILGMSLALSQIGFTADNTWSGGQGLENAKQIMYKSANNSELPSYTPPVQSTYSNSDNGWVVWSDNPIGSVAINSSSVAKTSLGNPSMWIRFINKKPNKKVFMTKMLVIADCEQKKTGSTHIITYDKNQNLIENVEMPDYMVFTNMASPDPDSTQYKFMKYLCSAKN